MEEIKIEAFKYALSIIQEGFVFEKFAQSFLTAVTGYNFMPVGGVKDKGIDGLEYIKKRNGFSKQIYQFSTEKDIKGKIENTIDSLRKNKISFDILIYATNREVKNKEQLIDGFIDKEKVFLRIYDLSWFVLHANYSNGTRAAFFTFVESNLHEYSKPGKAFAVSSMDKDSRLFVFLRQQLESKRWDLKIDKVLADTLILFSLVGTDPDLGIVKTSE